MSFPFVYKKVVRAPNPMVNLNPLKRVSKKPVSLSERVEQLNKNINWKKTIKKWNQLNKVVDASRLPKVTMEKLGDLWIDKDIQRALNEKHCAYTIGDPDKYDPALMQPVQCIKTSDGKFISIDAQHTVTTFAGLIDAGLLAGVTDWREMLYPFMYIETDNLAFARRAFGILNGKGKKKQSQYQQLRNAVFVIRIDKDFSDPEDVLLEQKVTAAEKHECFPIEVESDFTVHPGTFSNIATFKTLTVDEIDMACKWHNDYFHRDNIHAALFFIFRDLSRGFAPAKMKITKKLLEELAALVQSLFGDLSQFAESAKSAYREYTTKQWSYELAWDDDAYACALLELYVKFGGKEKIPPAMLNKFDNLIDFFDDDILAVADAA